MRLRRSLFAAALLAVAVSVEALEGIVTDPEGVPIAGARVTIIGRAGSVVADGKGRFTIEPVPDLPFILFVARADGVAFSPMTITNLPQDGPLAVTVAPLGETISVVSGALPDLEMAPASASTLVGRADLDQRNPTRLAEVIENTPGAGTTSQGHAVVPSLRGLPKHRTLIMLDEARVTAERRAGPSASFLDPETVDEVEVVRGPGSVAYGSDAFGGVIRARTRLPQLDGGTEVRYNLIGGTSASEWGAAAEVATGALGGGVMIGAHVRQFDDYSSPEGTVHNSGAEERGFRLGYQRTAMGGVLRVGWRTDESLDVGKPEPGSEDRRVFYPEESSHRFHIAFERPGPGSWTRLAASAAWDSYGLSLEKDRTPTEDTPRDIVRSDTDAQDYELRFEAERPVGTARLVVGANAYGRFDLEAQNSYTDFDFSGQVSDTRTEIAIESARRDDIGLFAALSQSLGGVDFSAGVRGDSVRSKNRGGYFGDDSTDHSDMSGFLAATIKLAPSFHATVQVARGFRDALLSDRYYRGESGRGFITGNPDLEPESSRQLDVALRYRSGSFQLAGYAYLYRISDLIERYRDDGDYYFRNRGEAEIKGVEIEASLALGDGYGLQVGAHILRGEIRDDGSPTDDIPAPGIFAVVRRETSSRWSWMLRGAAYDRDDRPGPTEQVVSGYAVLDAALGWRLSEAVELRLLGRNLLDKAYLASADEDAVLAPGRSLQLALRGTL